jgi:hypothetical protein
VTLSVELSRLSATLFTLLLASLSARAAQAQTAADSAAIRAAMLDYGEGWYGGDASRMERALHPELVKRILVVDTTTKGSMISGMGKTVLVNSTRRGGGRNTPMERRKQDVVIHDITGNAAVAKLTMADWVDYAQLVRVDGRWMILNVLWETTPK